MTPFPPPSTKEALLAYVTAAIADTRRLLDRGTGGLRPVLGRLLALEVRVADHPWEDASDLADEVAAVFHDHAAPPALTQPPPDLPLRVRGLWKESRAYDRGDVVCVEPFGTAYLAVVSSAGAYPLVARNAWVRLDGRVMYDSARCRAVLEMNQERPSLCATVTAVERNNTGRFVALQVRLSAAHGDEVLRGLTETGAAVVRVVACPARAAAGEALDPAAPDPAARALKPGDIVLARDGTCEVGPLRPANFWTPPARRTV